MHKHDRHYQYHSLAGYVDAGNLTLEIAAIWDGIDHAEAEGVALNHIGEALRYNWTACVTALAFKNIATLRALIDEARS